MEREIMMKPFQNINGWQPYYYFIKLVPILLTSKQSSYGRSCGMGKLCLHGGVILANNMVVRFCCANFKKEKSYSAVWIDIETPTTTTTITNTIITLVFLSFMLWNQRWWWWWWWIFKKYIPWYLITGISPSATWPPFIILSDVGLRVFPIGQFDNWIGT